MARQYVLTKVPQAQMDAVNNFLIALFGDPPDSQEITLNAYEDGEAETVATHSFGSANCSQSEANSVVTFCGGLTGCAAVTRPTSGSYDFWALALELFGLRPVVPEVP